MIAASRRFQIASIFACYAVAGVFWGSYVASLPAFQSISGLSEGRFGLLITATTIGGIVAMQGLGRVLHRVQAWAIPVCLTGFAAGMVLLGLAQGPLSIALALLVAGAASGALDISLNMRVARIEGEFGLRLFNRVHALFPFSMLVVSALVGLAREAGATPGMVFPPLALLLVVAAAIERHAGAHQRPDPDAPKGKARLRLRGVLLAFGALAAIGAIMEGGAHVWSAIYVEHPLAAGPALAGFASAAITLGLTVGRLAAHQIEHRFRDMAILRTSALVAFPAFLILAVSDSAWVAILGFFVAGVGIGPIEPAVFRSVTKRHQGPDRGRALALATGLAYVGYLASPPVFGAIIQSFGWPQMWIVAGAFGLAASALTLRIPPAAVGHEPSGSA